MRCFTYILFSTLAFGAPEALKAQSLKGHIADQSCFNQQIVIAQARGSSFTPVDSILIGPTGDFQFNKPFDAPGFYRISINDSNAVDIILDPREKLVQINFDSIPLSEHVHVVASDENMRLWEFKYISKETQAVEAAVNQQRLNLQPTDTTALEELDKVEKRAYQMRDRHLEELMERAPDSYFAKVLRVDKAVQQARGKGPMAVATAFDFSDPGLLHSSVYDKAVMGFLQNLNAVSEGQIANAADTLMRLAGRDPNCRTYMLGHLIDLFATYGPEVALQHVIDNYVAPLGDSHAIAPELRDKVEALLQVSVGRTAPDITLNDRGTLTHLSLLVQANRYTALFFYSSTCEHCHAQMPGLENDRRKYLPKGFNVIGIALDVDSADFIRSIQENAIPWKCYSEFNGWGAVSAKTFQVKATPTFFLLDDKMKIVAKPANEEELGAKLGELLK